jgi:hypothetical protein
VRFRRKRSTIMAKIEELRRAFRAELFDANQNVGGLVWERDAEARYQLAEWIESDKLISWRRMASRNSGGAGMQYSPLDGCSRTIFKCFDWRVLVSLMGGDYG